jgi:hypothetical protein
MADMETCTRSRVLSQLLEPVASCLTPDLARQIAALRADTATQERLDELAAKSTEGELTPAELREYRTYVDALDLIGVLQAKARHVLRNSPAA